jgi:membrane protease YdiL (CAAX protease family)
MRFFTILFYFLLAIVFMSSIGVSLPYIFDNMNNDVNIIKNLNQNIITYFIAILVAASLDIFLNLIDKNASYKKLVMLILVIINIGATVGISFVLYKNSKNELTDISYYAIAGIILSYMMWWFANYKNPNFDVTNANSTLGGNPDRTLTNG